MATIKKHEPTAGIATGFDYSAAEFAKERQGRIASYVWAVTRVSLGFVFLWAFLDKMFGFGKATPEARAWVNGGSPTTGFLKGVKGPFADMFHSMAGNAFFDWLFMLGLLGIGIGLIAGIAMRVTAGAAVVLLAFMWMASLPLETNPFIDDHLIYAMVAIGLAASNAGDTFGLGRIWASIPLVRRFPVLR